jgi:large subunit ribosomal protein L6e
MPTVTKKFGKKGQERKVEKPRAPRFYPADDAPKKHLTRTAVSAKLYAPKAAASKTLKLRKSITPGTVLIILAGRFRGKRVVFLQQLASGLLLVTGPYKINGVPLRRVNQAYVIATSTRVDITGLNLPAHINDAYFKKPSKRNQTKTADSFFVSDDKTKKAPLPDNKKADQKAVDSAIIASIDKVPLLSSYLANRFSLQNGQYPHQIKF